MATHSSTLAWKMPWMEEPGGLLSMGSHRVRHDRSDLASAALAARSVLPSNRPATPLFSPACWELGFQAWAQSTCPELPAQGLVPLRCPHPATRTPHGWEGSNLQGQEDQ